ncbi:MAG: TldD/PmbA family protein [Alphaproteobacteria bacterium]|nr:TldD/PmbA family protein [Alphaproteobacteria bacterium]MCB9698978.1 TldD/PmbA family protein [Alphaproteobacteria bacterium]
MQPLTDPANPWAAFAPFGVDADLVRKVLAEATQNGADDADVYFEHSVSTGVGLSDGIVNRAHTSIDLGAGVRVVVGDQVGYAYTEDLSLEALVHAARTARTIASGSPHRTPPVFVERVAPTADHYPVQRLWSDVELDVRVPMIRDWEQRAFARDPRVHKVQTTLGDGDAWVLVARADGTVASDYRPMTQGAVWVTAAEGKVRETGSYNVAARADLAWYDQTRQRRMVEEAVDRALRALGAGSPPAGEMPVVLAAGSSGVLLHEAIGHGMEADFNRKNTSIYSTRLGRSIAPAEVTIVDDATLHGARGALNVDDEGSATQCTTLVREGILESYLHDRISARHYGVPSTGSGRRESFRHPVLPRMRATYMLPGKTPPAEIIKSVKNGLYAEVFGNGAVQIGAGDFSFFVRHGRLIEDGKLTRPVKDVNLIGNGPEVLAAIEMVGDDLVVDEGGWTCGKDGQSVPVSQGMPTVLVRKVSVGGGRA